MIEERAIREQNPWWVAGNRILEDKKVVEALSKRNKLVYEFTKKSNALFVGPRQTGKTTFFKLLIHDLIINKGTDPAKIVYFSCETLRNFEDIVELVRIIDRLIEGEKYIFLDEVSFVEGWERAIKYILDSPLSKNKIFYITGSSSVALKKESFPGRPIEIQDFLPLTLKGMSNIFGSAELKKILQPAEFSSVSEVYEKSKKLFPFQEELDSLLYKYLQCGGFPKPFYELMENGGEIREETYDTYWNWLVHDIAKLEKSEKIASGVLLGILKNYSSKFSLSSIAKEVEIGSHVTVREYMELLEDMFAIRNFYTFDLNKKLVVYRKMRKAFFIDPFLFHVFRRKIAGKTLMGTEEQSKLVEGMVAESIARRINDEFHVGFYHDNQKNEIDVCFRNFGIEVKWQENVSDRDFPKVVDVKNKVLVSKNKLEFHESQNLLVVPVSLFLSLV